MTQIVTSVEQLQQVRRGTLNGSVGLVPTMGALHQGHLSLMERCRQENDHTIASIFVNPTQFNSKEDLDKYPNTLQADVESLTRLQVDVIFTPRYEDLYADGYRYRVSESQLSGSLCGAHRPGHFDGVLSVVLKLLNLAQADRAYFGEKDWQQLELIRGMAEAFFLPTTIVPCPTVREHDGLAMSSRNLRLTPEAREKAPLIYRELTSGRSLPEIQKNLEEAGFHVDYLTEEHGRKLVAAWLDNVRLIDNVAL